MQLMSKLLIATLLTGSVVGCADAKETPKSKEKSEVVKDEKSLTVDQKTQKRLLEYVKRAISVNRDYKLKEIRIRQAKEVKDLPGWKVYFLDIDLKMLKQNGKEITVHDKIFSNGKYIVRDFINIVNRSSLKDKLVPDMDESFYRKDHLIYGKESAPNKIVVYSDPICPFCQGYMPKLLKAAKENPDKIALYYYHFPLVMLHKEAPTIIKATMVAEKQGVKDVMEKVYAKKFNLDTGDEKKILEAFNKAMGTHITVKDIHAKDIEARYNQDKAYADKMMISGTPTVYFNGKKDFSRRKYEEAIKKK
jgi:protein-disulfide isomerase